MTTTTILRFWSTCSIRHAHVITMDDAGTIIPDGAVAITGRRISHVGPDAEVAAGVVAARPSTPGVAPSTRARGDPPPCVLPDLPERGARPDPRGGHLPDHREALLRRGDRRGGGARRPPRLAGDGAQRHDLLPGGGHRSCSRTPRPAPRGPWASGRSWATCASTTSRAASRRARSRAHGGPGSSRGAPRTWIRRSPAWVASCAATATRTRSCAGTSRSWAWAPRPRRCCWRRSGCAARRASCSTCTTPTPADTEADRQRYGKDPVLHLAEIGVLDRYTTLGAREPPHGRRERGPHRDAARALAWAPAASMMWGHGGTHHGGTRRSGGAVANIGLGSDSANWTQRLRPVPAGRTWRCSRRVMRTRTARYLLAEDGLRMATRGGARAAGLEAKIGSIEVGKRADLVLHTLDRPEMRPITDMMRNLVFSSRSKSIRSVIIDGRVVARRGPLPAPR